MDSPPRRVICDDDVCWVCLEGPNESVGKLEYPCSCPRGVHAKCLARWQLQSAGREEERYCRFCKSELPDWRDILTPKVPAAAPVMAIVYDGKVVRLQVKPGPEGMLEFQREVRRAFNLGEDVELDCVFDCRAPGTGEKIKLRGLESYSAAMHCAAVAAGERIAKQKADQSNGIGRFRLDPNAGSGGSTSSSGGGSPAASGSATANSGPSHATTGCGFVSRSVGSRSSSSTANGTAVAGVGNSTPGATPGRATAGPQQAAAEGAASTPLPGGAATAAVTAATQLQSQVTPRIAPGGSPLSSRSSTADCQLPSARTPRYGQGPGECGAGALSPAGAQPGLKQGQSEGGGSTGRRKNIFMGLVRGLGAVRRIL